MKQPLHLKNAIVVAHGQAQRRDLYIDRGRFTAQPAPRALTVDLDGETLFAGLVNAHDHLELNHYPRTAYRQVYTSAHHWGDDVNARLDTLPFRVRRAYPLRDRLFIGGLKNLLCGATTVIQHGPAHAALFRPDFPVRVLRPYGWSHSLHFSPAAAVVASYRRTPPGVPWFIHLAEGTDAAAAGEYQRLKALGCAGSNTVLVHGVGLREDDIADAAPRVRGLVWCPTTNQYLLGRLPPVLAWQQHGGRHSLGSDSRLTAAGDLGDELRAAQALLPLPALLAGMALFAPGALAPGQPADLVLAAAPDGPRSAIRLVMRAGVPRLGAPEIMSLFPQVPAVPAVLDGVAKRLHRGLARQYHRCMLQEAGFTVAALSSERRWHFWR